MCPRSVRKDLRGWMAFAFAMAFITVGAAEAQAQTGQISGQLTNTANGQPVDAAQVSVQGTTLGGLSGVDGNYTISNVPVGTHTVIVQRIGFQRVERTGVTVAAGAPTVLNLQVSEQALQLDAIVATGLVDPLSGRRSPITVGRIDRDNMPVPAAGTALQSLAGQMAGVTVARGSGEPGEETNILLRSPTMIGCDFAGFDPGCPSMSPLIVVDGVILGGGTGGTVNLESMDIESIEVVRGAAGASLYGSRANNGVISITTSRGSGLQQGQTQLQYRSEFGWQSPIDGLDVPTHHAYLMNDEQTAYVCLTATQCTDVANEDTTDDIEDGDLVPGDEIPQFLRFDETTDDFNLFMDNDYADPLFDNVNNVWDPGAYQQHTFSLSQNAVDTNFFLSLNRNVQGGSLPQNDGYTRNSFRMNLDHRFLNTLSLGVSMFHSRDYRDNAVGVGNTSSGGILNNMLEVPPDVDLTARPQTFSDSIASQCADGANCRYSKAVPHDPEYQNPLWVNPQVESERWQVRTLASSQVRWEPSSWVSFNGSVSYDRQDTRSRSYLPLGIQVGNDTNGNLSFDTDARDTWNADVSTQLRRDFGNLNSRLTLRASMERENSLSVDADGTQLNIANTPTLEAVLTDFQRSTSSEFEIRSTGMLADLALDYGGRYIGSVLLRRDGSSLFGEEERWQTYYRVAGKWRLSEEEWFPIDALDEFSVAVSRGTAGGRPGFQAQYETYSLNNGGLTKQQLGNNFLKPSNTTEHDISVQAIVGRWEITGTYATQTTTDQLQSLDLLAFQGFPDQWVNGGTIKGETLEFTLNGTPIQSSRFAWNTTVVADRSNSIVEEWPFPCDGTISYRFRCEGIGMFEVWGSQFVTQGLFEEHLDGALVGFEDEFDVNDDGLLVWVGAGRTFQDGAGDDGELFGNGPDGIHGNGDDYVEDNLWGTTGTVNGTVYNWGMPFLNTSAATTEVRRERIGDARHWNLGWVNNLNFGAFSMNAQFHAKLGGDIQNNQDYGLIGDRTSPQMDQAGRPTGLVKPVEYYEQLALRAGTDWFNQDGTYLKIRSVSLNYRFTPTQLARFGLSNAGVSGLTLGLIGRDLFTYAPNYTGWDPEQGISLNGGAQTSGAAYPPTSSYSAEFQVTF